MQRMMMRLELIDELILLVPARAFLSEANLSIQRNKNPKQPFEISPALVAEITVEVFPSMRMGNESDEPAYRSKGNWVKYYKEFSAYSGPHGSAYIVARRPARRLCWGVLMTIGVLGSLTGLIKCTRLYRQFRGINKIEQIMEMDPEFPQIAFCLNSLHSRFDMQNKYPTLYPLIGNLYNANLVNATNIEEIAANISDYTENMKKKYSKNSRHYPRDVAMKIQLAENLGLLKNITMFTLYQETRPDFDILACRSGENVCRESWNYKLFQEGSCKIYTPGNSSSLNIVLAYNASDWSAGWTHFLDGFSMYYSDKQQRVLDFKKSLQVSSKSIPIVKLHEQITTKLGPPYSNCTKKGKLAFYDKYTEEHCLKECSINRTLALCNCKAPFFPDKIPNGLYRNCSLFDHITCVKRELLESKSTSNTMLCKCDKDCQTSAPGLKQVQYGHKWINTSTDIDHEVDIASILITMESSGEKVTEHPEYPFIRYLSDIGGCFGLFLGISAATFFGFIELIINIIRKLLIASLCADESDKSDEVSCSATPAEIEYETLKQYRNEIYSYYGELPFQRKTQNVSN